MNKLLVVEHEMMGIIEIAYEAGKEFDASDIGTPCLVPYCDRIVTLVKNNPDKASQYEEDFLEMWLEPKKVPHELLALCMYHLKLSGFKSYIEDYRRTALRNDKWRAESPTRMILDAYEESWEDYDLFYD